MEIRIAIDANNCLHRFYHAMGAARAAQQWPRYLDAMCGQLADYDATRTHVCFDGPKGTAWRRELVPEYKSSRSEKPADLVELLERAAEFAAAEGYDVPGIVDAEADDLIASIVTRHAESRVVVVSSDKDLYQLLEAGRVAQLPKVSTAAPSSSDFFTAARFAAEFGVRPGQWPAWRAIAGDKSDGLAGVPGCGPAVAGAILQRFATLAEAVANQWALPCTSRHRIAITSAARSGYLERFERVATLRRDALDLALSEGGA